MAVGIDVSKATLDVTVLVASKPLYRQVKNELTGWCDLCHWLDEMNAHDNPVCMEDEPMLHPHQSPFRLWVIINCGGSPRQARAHAS